MNKSSKRPGYREQRQAPQAEKFDPNRNMRSPQEKGHVNHLMKNEIEELKDTVRYLEHQLVSKRQEQEEYLQEIFQANAQAKDSEVQCIKEQAITQKHAQNYKQLEKKFEDHKVAQDHIVEKATLKFGDYQNEINNKEEELASMRARLHNKAEELKIAEIGAVTNHIRANDFGAEIVEREEIIQQLKSEVQDLKQQLHETQAQRKSEGTALLEVEHIKADNERLIKLLKKTKEFKEFGKYTETISGSVRYLPSAQTEKCIVKKCPSNATGENIDPNIEKDHWIPQEAFEIAYKIKTEHDGQLNDLMINQLLQSLNKVWRERERKNIARIKSSCNHQLQKMKRQITHTEPLTEVNARSEISRLKYQLSDTQKKLRENVVLGKRNLREASITDEVEAAFKVAGCLQDERNRVVQENKALKTRIIDAEKLHMNEDFERSKFMQGAAWQATKSYHETHALEQKITDLVTDFKDHERNLYLKDDQIGLQLFREKNHQIVLEEINNSVKDTTNNFKKMMENATDHFDHSNKQVEVLGGKGSYIH
ncbi:unnamed protein product [Moneuplotes crassus]|uniref:Uncharacterized protein n=1 Tax=Euplotes crassus TaxID=5936 RepID=A0AAD1UCU5_EUPCR|nr:unnamed protein product [Moneuplotes crassus]